jgi:CubicO group peptidase (beta-lactamase class C family)
MPGAERILPDRPSLRYLKLEAKRRLAAGEFRTLHEVQLALAREYGQPSWAKLRQLVADRESHALAQVRWIIARFRDAGQPGWIPVGDEEMREHFSGQVLAAAPGLAAQLAAGAVDLRADPVISDASAREVRLTLSGMMIMATAEAEPPYRLEGLFAIPVGARVQDTRVKTAPPAVASGDCPADMAEIADDVFDEFGLPALALAGASPGQPPWIVTKGWADLDRAEVLDATHRFPATGATMAVTALAVLRLIAENRLTLDTPANDLLRTVRLADSAITVRELLSHTGGVDSPAGMYADAVPETTPGTVIGCGGQRGVFQPSNGGCGVLGWLIADVTQTPYATAVTELVLEPLGLKTAGFPGTVFPGKRTAALDSVAGEAGDVTQYDLTPDGQFRPAGPRICVIPAAGGLWATPADMVKLGTGWSSLLPDWLARAAVTSVIPLVPHARGVGLGWLLNPDDGTAVHAGAAPGAVASLTIRVRDNRTLVVLISRMVPLDLVEARVKGAWS